MAITSCISMPLLSPSLPIHPLLLQHPTPTQDKSKENSKEKEKEKKRKISCWNIWCDTVNHTVYSLILITLLANVYCNRQLVWFIRIFVSDTLETGFSLGFLLDILLYCIMEFLQALPWLAHPLSKQQGMWQILMLYVPGANLTTSTAPRPALLCCLGEV